ncbi:hypothetical protein [Sphingobium yanoikuyae]
MRPRLALSEGMREIDAQRGFDALNRIKEEYAKLFLEQVKINGVPELGTWRNWSLRIVRVGLAESGMIC